MSDTKFYFAENSNRKFIAPKGRRIVFENIDQFAGTWRGVFATDNAEDIKVLDVLVNTERTGVKEITAEEYATWQQKKTPNSRDFQPLHSELAQERTNVPAPASSLAVLTGKGAKVVENPVSGEVPEVSGAPVDVDAVLNPVEEVAPPAPEAPKHKGKKHK